ncbi:hypothetical protein OQA88_1933 [Cercophora sp. LCS_1]
MASSTPPTILDIKQTFLAHQVRTLSTPLNPSAAWQSSNTTSEQPLPAKPLDDALFKLNARLSQHSKRVYPPQATRHVAEQIDQLYWNSALAVSDSHDINGDGGVHNSADLVDDDVIASLPTEWDDGGSEEQKRYAELVGRLKGLAKEREKAREGMERLRGMKDLLGPFDEVERVQENLVTRDGEVERELSRMRVLLARVGGRVGMLGKGTGREEEMEEGETGGVEGLVERF